MDASALLLGFTESSGELLLTCKEVLEEVRYGGAAPYRVAAVREKAGLRVREPKAEYVERVMKAAAEAGEQGLSEADVKLLALTLELSEEGWDASLVTSDYAVQNIASLLGLQAEAILHRGIREEIRWETYCPACGWSGGGVAGGVCPRCGARLKRRPRKVED